MKWITLAILPLTILVTSCAEKRAGAEKVNVVAATEILVEAVPEVTVEKSMVTYHRETSLWTLYNEPYSGYFVTFYPDGSLKEKTGVFNGKKQNQSIKWYPDGHLQEVASYHEGKLHGVKKFWSSDTSHVLVKQLNYQFGKAHGAQKQWYPTGELYKKLNMNMGREEGMQQAFRKNGDLYANYEARNGRIFGLKKAALCYGLEDENIRYER